MKDGSFRSIPKDAIYKDVVIIGNGPSGITLSYMLAGHWPYWIPEKIQTHPDELLRARLNYADCTKSLIKQDLIELAEGLEGRSTNPISLLLDSLEHPCADLGLELPSMLEYKYHPNAKIDHIVLGKGPPGGSWHKMDPNLRTLSLAAWMSLPGLSYNAWEMQRQKIEFLDKSLKNSKIPNLHRQAIKNSSCQKCAELRMKRRTKGTDCDLNDASMNNNESEMGALCCKCTKALTNSKNTIPIAPTTTTITNNEGEIKIPDAVMGSPPRRNLSLKRQVSKEVQTRALVSRVAKYYEDYVRLMDLEKYFLNDAIVTAVAPILAGSAQGKFRSARWMVCGVNRNTYRPFYYACANIVLANGASDLANRLGLRGEDLNWVKHELPQLETALESLSDNERSSLRPVLVVGAGLSAADAITICRSSDIHVIHVFRSRTAGLDKMLPENVYPEYHEVHRMMKDQTNNYKHYTPVPEHTICDLMTGSNGVHTVTVENMNTGEQKTFEVSFCAILIGSKPDLRFISGISNKNLQRSVSLTSSLANEKLNSSSAQENITIFGRKISWLKNLCAKCKHLNLCEWNRSGSSDNRKAICSNQIITEVNSECNNKYCEKESVMCTMDENGLGLGVDSTKPVDCKTNQIAVNKYTNEVIGSSVKGLYAMGPLVGDNFVRFIPGGALAITAALHKEND